MGNEGVDTEQVHVQDLSAGDILPNTDDFGLNVEEETLDPPDNFDGVVEEESLDPPGNFDGVDLYIVDEGLIGKDCNTPNDSRSM